MKQRPSKPIPLTVETVLAAYRIGAFPMARSRRSHQVEWFTADPRGVLPLNHFHCSASLKRLLRQGIFEIRHDTAFEQVVRCCAAPRAEERETWINGPIIDVYTQLHVHGVAHSIECWRGGQLVGGLYGVTLGAAFFGESMFHIPGPGKGDNASKVALAKTVEHLSARGYRLFDVQFRTPFLARFGVIEMPADDYMRKLTEAMAHDVKW